MTTVWPWLVLGGVGALHGLNPATGWGLAAGWGVQSRDKAQALRALLPIALGHLASIALVAGAVVYGVSMDRTMLQVMSGALFVALAWAHLSGHAARRARAPAGHAALAAWSFMMSTAHGSGLVLVPALMPLCFGDAAVAGAIGGAVASAGAASGVGSSALTPLVAALSAVAVHTAGMLLAAGLMAAGVCRGLEWARRRIDAIRCLWRIRPLVPPVPRDNARNMSP